MHKKIYEYLNDKKIGDKKWSEAIEQCFDSIIEASHSPTHMVDIKRRQ